jgi:hypothetical protein
VDLGASGIQLHLLKSETCQFPHVSVQPRVLGVVFKAWLVASCTSRRVDCDSCVQVLQAAAGAGRTVIDVDRDLEEQEAHRSAKQITRDQLLARVNDLRHAPSNLTAAGLPSVGAAYCTV